jgi:hypothetical protein
MSQMSSINVTEAELRDSHPDDHRPRRRRHEQRQCRGVRVPHPRLGGPGGGGRPVAVFAPLYVPTCTIVSVPFVNAFTGVTYLVPRRVCN